MNRRGKYTRVPLLIAVLFLLALIPLALFRGSQVPEAEAAWWDNSWRYRKSIQVTNNTTQQSNVYISLVLDTSDTTKFQDDCGDLRFTKLNGQVLPYYIASGCGTASTSVRVQLETFPAGVQMLYAYYGNPSAPNGSASNDFLLEATNYSVEGTGSEEIAPGPIAYWKFDEGSGGTAHDAAGDNHGTIAGATWTDEDQCVSGKCLSFNGTSDYVATPRQISSLNKGFTIQAWAYLTASSEWRWIVGEASDSYFFIGKSNQGNFMHIGFNGVFGASNISEAVFHPNQWYHVTVAWDGTTNSNSIKIYLNGGLVAQRRATGTSLSNGNLNIGRRSISEFWQGQIDEVKIFPYALTEDQIKAEYNLGAAAVMGTGPTVAPPAGGPLSDSLVAHWAFDEQYGQAAHDGVGNHHGTFGASTSPGSDDPTWKPAGECKVNGCLGFDGGDDFLIDSNPINLPTGSQATWSWWSKTSFNTGYSDNAVMGESRSQWSIRQTSTVLYLGLGNEQSTTTVSFPQDTDWSYYAIVFDSGNAVFYKNGEQIGTYSFTSTTVPVLSTFYIARRSTAPPNAYNFDGSLDEVKIYNTALTADQVKQDMNAGASVAYSVGSEEADELADGAGAPPIAEWKFDEKQGTVAYDSSGNANDGTVNGATWKSGCQQGACLVFDGNDYVLTADSPTLDIDGEISISAWFNPSVITNYQTIIGKRHVSYTSANYVVRTGIGSNSDELEFYFVSGGSWQVFTTSNANLVAGNWYHVTVVYDEVALPRIYLNGALLTGSCITSTCIGAMTPDSNPVGIGRPGNPNQHYFSGRIDHVKIYDYARTPAQIAYDYNRGAPVAHWKFDECEGSIAHDSSDNQNHGTINIGATEPQTTAGTCQTSGAWANGKDGKFNGSLNFDGTDDVVAIPDYSLTTDQITMTAWVKPYSVSGMIRGIIVSRSTSADVESLNTKYGKLGYSWGPDYSSNLAIPINQWSFAAVTIGPDKATLYLSQNGKMVSETQNREHSTRTLQGLKIGNDDVVSDRFFPGQIDDVRIYNYALSPDQILKVYNQGQAVNFTRAN